MGRDRLLTLQLGVYKYPTTHPPAPKSGGSHSTIWEEIFGDGERGKLRHLEHKMSFPLMLDQDLALILCNICIQLF